MILGKPANLICYWVLYLIVKSDLYLFANRETVTLSTVYQLLSDLRSYHMIYRMLYEMAMGESFQIKHETSKM